MTTNRIYLTGFMGSGKSTIGPILARRLNRPFLDLDAMIVEEIGQPIAQFFQESGEATFRQIETRLLKATGDLDRAVIAVGGGALVEEANLAWAKANGCVVYLRLPVGLLLGRLWEGRFERPMLHGPEGEPLEKEAARQRIESLLEARAPAYEAAHIIVDAYDATLGRIAAMIQESLEA